MSARRKLLQSFMAVAVAGLVIGVGPVNPADAANSGGASPAPAKAVVCKYVGTPGVDEQLQTGQNPIVIGDSQNYKVGDSFTDAQGRSVVIAIIHQGDPVPPVGACPAPQGPTQPIPVASEMPTTIPVCGPNNDTVVWPKQLPGVVLKSDSGWVGEWRTITFVAAPGYALADSGRYILVDDNTPCGPPALVPVTPVAPSTVPTCGPNNDGVTLPKQPAGVLLQSDTGWSGGKRTVTYVAADGYTLSGNNGTFVLTDNNVPCAVPVVAVAPKTIPVCGPNNDHLALQDQPTGVILNENSGWVDGKLTVTYVAADGYVLSGNSGTFVLTDDNVPCQPELTPVTAVDGTFSCGPDANLVFTPAVTEGVTYVVKHMGSDLVVTAGVTDQSRFVLTNPDFFQQASENSDACRPTVTPTPTPTSTSTPTPTVPPTTPAPTSTPTATPSTPTSVVPPTSTTTSPSTPANTTGTVVNAGSTTSSNAASEGTSVQRGGSAQTGLTETATAVSGNLALAILGFIFVMAVAAIVWFRTRRRPAHRA